MCFIPKKEINRINYYSPKDNKITIIYLYECEEGMQFASDIELLDKQEQPSTLDSLEKRVVVYI